MTDDRSWEERGLGRAREAKAKSDAATARIDAAYADMNDWRARCPSCKCDLIGSLTDLEAHVTVCEERPPN